MVPVRAPTGSKNHPLVPIHPFTRQIVPLYSVWGIVVLKFINIGDWFSNSHTKSFLSSKKFYVAVVFFFLCIFFAHFLWACAWPPCESRNFYLKHSFSTYTCLSNNSLISAWISTKFVSTLLLCMLYQTNNFQHKANTSMYLRGTFTLYVDSFHNSDPL